MENKINKYKRITKGMIIFMAGFTFADLVWHIRFMKEIMREEMLIFMRDGNGYFLDWFYLGSIVFVIILIIYYFRFIYKKKEISLQAR